MKGVPTSCTTGKESCVELSYEIRSHGSPTIRYFQLIDGVTGYESFFIDDWGGKLKKNTLSRIAKNGWLACAGTEGKWDRLFIPAEEMRKAVTEAGLIR